jgi:hypothetical protein
VGTETGFDLGQGLARLATTEPCQGAVVEVFPQFGILAEVDDDGGFLSVFVDEELNAGNHGSSSEAACILAADTAREVVVSLRFRNSNGPLAGLHESCSPVG